ncbi:hypothetical protein RBH29_17475 [Herbivorax sp. ANBcel31]|uniref:hypothetical protein n=1 Tax=Herbivorax sp. ANBcel31 TaxID=3069754 RepID=UPI0027B83D71|nr:hypothetical protein [Herbivorax sp. ANBcel31]MDQ2088217.1 hypothetical protein [Herbivorax sp. ANBcel31]
MEKYSVFGELLYIGFVCEKGRCKSSGLWKWGYKKILYKHIVLLKHMIQCILVNKVTENDSYVLKKIVLLIQKEKHIGRYYPIKEEILTKLHECNYSIINSVDLGVSIKNINLLMSDIINEILELLDRGVFVDKKKITMLIRALHNLPRVYLKKNLQTICDLNQPSIEYKDAIQYAFSNMDENTKQKYKKYYQ